tara:strand:+ start:445 stop:615 length:171 start_codon:yes stop_codon:yes gene_type:complete
MPSVGTAGYNCTVADSVSTSILNCEQIAMNPEPNHTASVRKQIFVTGSSYNMNLFV